MAKIAPGGANRMFGDQWRTKKYDKCAFLHPKKQKDPHTTPQPLLVIFKTKKKEKEHIHLDSGYCPLRKPRSGAWVRPAVIIYQQYIQQEKEIFLWWGFMPSQLSPKSPKISCDKNSRESFYKQFYLPLSISDHFKITFPSQKVKGIFIEGVEKKQVF